MKRTERHHLKDNELAKLTGHAREAIGARKTQSTIALAVVVVIVAIGIGYFAWRERVEARAHGLLADAIAVQVAPVGPPPAPGTPSRGLSFLSERERGQAALAKFNAAADAHPSTDAGFYARYQEAATLMTLGEPAKAAAAYQQVVDRAGNRIYGQMARLGLAEAQARQGQYEQAINTYKDLAQRKDGPLPVDGILMQLGRTYLEAGKRPDAQQTFTRLVQEYPESPFSEEAKRELEGLKKT